MWGDREKKGEVDAKGHEARNGGGKDGKIGGGESDDIIREGRLRKDRDVGRGGLERSN